MRRTFIIAAILLSSAPPPLLAKEKTDRFVGTSPNRIEDALENAIKEAGQTAKSFEVVKIGGEIENGTLSKYQVTIKVRH
jgi:flavin-binding protein dodecin